MSPFIFDWLCREAIARRERGKIAVRMASLFGALAGFRGTR